MTAVGFLLNSEWRIQLLINMECQNCPFSEVDTEREPPNPSSPGEGHYKCALLKRTVWGEDPECDTEVWRTKIREEVALK